MVLGSDQTNKEVNLKTTHEQRTKKGHDTVINIDSPVNLASDQTNKVVNPKTAHEQRTKKRHNRVINIDSPVDLGAGNTAKGLRSELILLSTLNVQWFWEEVIQTKGKRGKKMSSNRVQFSKKKVGKQKGRRRGTRKQREER